MAKELQALGGTTGQTVYARLWSGVGTIWNGSAFEAYVAGNYATYDIALTEAGATGSYFGDFPVLITAAGTYGYEALRQVGGSPAQSDPVLGVGAVEWSGTGVEVVGATGLLDLAAGVETGRTLRQSLRLILASAANKLAGAATSNVTVRDTADTKDRITATVDADGNRTAVTYDVS